MSRQHKILFPKLTPGCSSFQHPGSDLLLNQRDEGKSVHRIFRTKRKHVQRACDRCRVKKSKCDGSQPCSRCKAYNHACIFRDRKATQEKVYSRGFVEMLISQHAVHLQALRDLYKRCVTREGFPGSPLQESVQGYPGTHEILDRLGLIKHAEETIEDPQKVLADIMEYVKSLNTSSECLDCAESTDTSNTTVSGEASPEPSTPKEALDSSMPPMEYPWTGVSESRMYDGYESLQQQQQHINAISTVHVDDTRTFRNNNFGHSEAVLWNNTPSQLRYIPTAASDATCQRNGLPTEMPWPAMTGHHPATLVAVSSRDGTSGPPFYSSGQTFIPELFGYAHFYDIHSSA